MQISNRPNEKGAATSCDQSVLSPFLVRYGLIMTLTIAIDLGYHTAYWE